jgi:hypothetical protein
MCARRETCAELQSELCARRETCAGLQSELCARRETYAELQSELCARRETCAELQSELLKGDVMCLIRRRREQDTDMDPEQLRDRSLDRLALLEVRPPAIFKTNKQLLSFDGYVTNSPTIFHGCYASVLLCCNPPSRLHTPPYNTVCDSSFTCGRKYNIHSVRCCKLGWTALKCESVTMFFVPGFVLKIQ